ncbi:hypothetical protein E2C01_051692 [Portunus trituberculatus]|uniref:Transmembrane protein n=1 Tax=Portunus trituberculatus TaxID=210409 RepID=A0A5B7GK14_PORTR|nr:hypothetical protein [Portunus trituberculatus]
MPISPRIAALRFPFTATIFRASGRETESGSEAFWFCSYSLATETRTWRLLGRYSCAWMKSSIYLHVIVSLSFQCLIFIFPNLRSFSYSFLLLFSLFFCHCHCYLHFSRFVFFFILSLLFPPTFTFSQVLFLTLHKN